MHLEVSRRRACKICTDCRSSHCPRGPCHRVFDVFTLYMQAVLYPMYCQDWVVQGIGTERQYIKCKPAVRWTLLAGTHHSDNSMIFGHHGCTHVVQIYVTFQTLQWPWLCCCLDGEWLFKGFYQLIGCTKFFFQKVHFVVPQLTLLWTDNYGRIVQRLQCDLSHKQVVPQSDV